MYNRDLIKYIDEICVIDTSSIEVKSIEKDFYTLSFIAFNGELNKNIKYDVRMEYSYDLDEDEDGSYIENIYTRIGYFQQLKKNPQEFFTISSLIWDSLYDFIENNFL